MKIIKHTLLSKFIDKIGYSAISLFGIIFCENEPSKSTVNHESIHFEQQKELLFIGFFVLYFLEYLTLLIIKKNHWKAYYAISFEKEAFKNEWNFDYLKSRKRYFWIKFLG